MNKLRIKTPKTGKIIKRILLVIEIKTRLIFIFYFLILKFALLVHACRLLIRINYSIFIN